MPKRSPAYMEAQRERLARKFLESLLENGMANCSVQSMCAAAGVTSGAFYTHFADREEAVFFACALDHMNAPRMPTAHSWDAYEAALTDYAETLRLPSAQKRLRLSYQFVAEMAVHEAPLPELENVWGHYVYIFRDSLEAMAQAGEITLPLGLDLTTRLHAQLCYGALHIMTVDKARTRRDVLADTFVAMAQIAGRK